MKWWQKTTIYQIYPRSFYDTNEDGIGDIPGIIAKLDYIQNLGFETIWISPFYKSPGKDFHYDISDYRDIDPIFGTLKDAENLIAEVHRRNMKIVFDMVLNHTSDEHPWFKESRSSKTNPKRDWYIWRKGKKNSPPNNWTSMINKPGWNYDPTTDEWYFANFLSFQPDLNYRNPEVKEAMFDVMRYWLQKGVDGFRLDIFNSIYKDPEFRDNPLSFRFVPTPDYQDEAFFQKKLHTLNHPDCFPLAKEVRGVIDEFSGDRFLIGEVSGNDKTLKKFLGEKQDGLNLVFQFELIDFEFSAKFFKRVLIKNENTFPYPYTPTYVYGNHDQMRYIDKIENNPEKAKLLALFQFTARGVPIVYYGEEIGIRDANIPNAEGKDPIAQQNAFIPNFFVNFFGIYLNRDNCRTPMQWSSAPHGGFSAPHVDPWLNVTLGFSYMNVESETKDPNSLLNAYKSIIKLRNEQESFQTGNLEVVNDFDNLTDLLVFRRFSKDKNFYVFLNFGYKPLAVRVKNITSISLKIGDARFDSSIVTLDAYAGIVLESD
ncbi:MAG TPA: alpha-glucosidase, partial [Leptospiraceae bacterium]|nr:alpha-glucosidase [Leptospiraceae bacterium]